MRLIKFFLVALVLLVNLMIAPPSWAGKDFTKGTDYAEVTQALSELLSIKDTPDQAGYTPEEYQQKLTQLQFQKYVMETAKKRAQCRNETGKTLAVYANKPKKTPSQIYFLASGKITDDDWDCDGVFVPAGTQVALGPNAQAQELAEPSALKIVDGTQLIAKSNPQTGVIELNVAPAKVFKAGEASWSIPTLSQADIDATAPSPQILD